MPSLIDLRRRIQSVKNTQQITKAMKMVSAAKLRRAQQAVVGARPYARLLEELLGSVLAASTVDGERASHRLLEAGDARRVLLLVLAGEKGLCGSFNSNLFKKSDAFIRRQDGSEVELELLGRKAVEHYGKRGHPISGRWERVFVNVDRATAQELADKAIERFASGGAGSVWIAYNCFRTILRQEVTVEQLLPVAPPAPGAQGGMEHEYEQPASELLAELLPKRVATRVHVAMLESAAAEHAARMAAMDAATRNAGEVLDNLRLHLNKVRQASITAEIIEIVSGTAAQE